ncbi:hypothetical protein ACWKSP_12715 [Micromonosporaceae bacterium Da 78-11]
MSAEVVAVQDGRRGVWWRALRLVLALMWVVAAALSWWTAPRESGYEQARQDIGAGRVTAYRWGSQWDDTGGSRMFGTPELSSSSPIGPLFAWRTGDDRVHWVDTNEFDEVTVADTDTEYANPGAASLAALLKERGVEDRIGAVTPFATVINGFGIALGVTFLAVLLAGPAPVRGTKWFWWWIGVTVPYGLGVLFWLARDRPWVDAAERVPYPAAPSPPGDRRWLPTAARFAREGAEPRDPGWLGVVTGLLASLVVSGLLVLLHHFLGDSWVPLLSG